MYNYLSPINVSKCQKVKIIEDENIYLEELNNNNNHKDNELLLEDTQSLDYGDLFADPVQSVKKILDLKKGKPANKCDKNLNSG